eukprot:sb/3475968/
MYTPPSGVNASYMLGMLFHILTESYCLDKTNERKPYCQNGETKENLRLVVGGGLLFLSVGLAFLNTCLTRQVNLPHSYAELRNLRARSSIIEGEKITNNGDHCTPLSHEIENEITSADACI